MDKPSPLTTPAGIEKALGAHHAGVRRKVANPDIKTKPSAVPAPFNGPTQATSPRRGVAMRSPVNDPQVGAGCGGAGRPSISAHSKASDRRPPEHRRLNAAGDTSKEDHRMAERVMTFGKYLGQPTRGVPLPYLLWVANTFRSTPTCVAQEIECRTDQAASRPVRVCPTSPTRRRRRSKTARRRTPAEIGREIPGKANRTGRFIGERFAEERAAWLAAGGDPLVCPWEIVQEPDRKV